jgi:hypothetical protein
LCFELCAWYFVLCVSTQSERSNKAQGTKHEYKAQMLLAIFPDDIFPEFPIKIQNLSEGFEQPSTPIR